MIYPYKFTRFFDKINVLVYRWSGLHAKNCGIRTRLRKQKRAKLRLIKETIEQIHKDNPFYTEQWCDEEAERWMKIYIGCDAEYVRRGMDELKNKFDLRQLEELKRKCELAELKEAVISAVSETIKAEIKRVFEKSKNGSH